MNWCLPGLYLLAQFLRSVFVEGFPYKVVEKKAATKAVYIIGRTLHVHILHMRKRDELNFILLATSLRVATEVRIHNFEIHYYLTWRREHVHLTQGYWNTVEFVLPYINRGPWVEEEGKRVRTINITFDDFMCPAVEARKANLPFVELIHQIPKYETDPIAS